MIYYNNCPYVSKPIDTILEVHTRSVLEYTIPPDLFWDNDTESVLSLSVSLEGLDPGRAASMLKFYPKSSLVNLYTDQYEYLCNGSWQDAEYLGENDFGQV